MTDKTPPTRQLQIEVPGDLTPIYTNFAIINHSYNEIVIDFAHVLTGAPKARVQQRLVLTPFHAKLLLNALQTNLAAYEKHFGEIKMQGAGIPTAPPGGFDPTQNVM
ncbi:MAG: DUF3467 domain-containing protein [Caldilineales bacterium]|nr:DUF3467 domain-containing protein [Caldilineales bacterium]